MKVLSGVYPYGDYSGEILFAGKVQHFRGIADSDKSGIAIIYQELALIPELTVYENIFLGHELRKGMMVDWNETIKRATDILRKVRLDINPATKIKELGVGKQQLVEIAKALSKDVKLLILDEPTAALDPIAEYEIYSKFNEIVGDKTAIYISHRLSSCRFCDDIAVFHEGKLIQRGSHDELVADEDGKYYELWHAQAQYYAEEAKCQ